MMKNIYFVSGNKEKFTEYQVLLEKTASISQIKLSLIEIQAHSLKLCEHKLIEAKKSHLLKEKNFFIEDTALYFTAWNDFPGVYIKWMLESLAIEKIYQSLASFKKEAIAECTIGYFSYQTQQTNFFQGRVKGKIVSPKGGKSFGWDALFAPQGQNKSYAQMTKKEKNCISHRFLATQKFQQFLQKN